MRYSVQLFVLLSRVYQELRVIVISVRKLEYEQRHSSTRQTTRVSANSVGKAFTGGKATSRDKSRP
jgi:hypothetical protein